MKVIQVSSRLLETLMYIGKLFSIECMYTEFVVVKGSEILLISEILFDNRKKLRPVSRDITERNVDLIVNAANHSR